MHILKNCQATLHNCVLSLRGLPGQLCFAALLISACAALLSADSIHSPTLDIKPMPNIQPGPAGDQYRAGIEAVNNKNLVKAKSAFERSLKIDPHMVGSYFMLAQIYLYKGESAEAGEYLQRAVQIAPKNPQAHLVLGRYLFISKHFSDAKKELIKASELDESDPSPMASLGDVYVAGLKEPRQAIAAYQKALARDPQSAAVHLKLAKVLAATGATSQALSELDQAANLAPQNSMPLMFKAQLLASGAHYLDALANYQAVLKISPNDAGAYTGLGMVYQQLNQPAEAQKAYHKAIQLDSRQAIAFNNLAWMAVDQKGNLDDALQWSQRAVALDPTNPGFEDTMGWVLHARGQLKEADATLEKASLIKPYNPEIFYHSGIVKSERGQSAEAEAALKKALLLSSNFSGAADARARIAALHERVEPKGPAR